MGRPKVRKIDDNLLLQMLKEGKLQKEIAEHFKVSEPAITKRLKKLIPPPKSLEQLTPKERKFVMAVAEGKSRTQACMESFDVSSRASAKVLQNSLMKNREIRLAIDELMEYHGLGRSYRIRRLADHVDNADPGISLKALDMSFRLDNSYPSQKVEIAQSTIALIDLSAYQKNDTSNHNESDKIIDITVKEKEGD